MSLDLESFPPTVKAQQIQLGQQFGSQDTLAQANQTLDSYAKHGAALAKSGFTAADAQRLGDARDLLIEAGVGREAARGQKKVTVQAYIEAIKQGQAARLEARTILEATCDDLEESGAADAPAAVRAVNAVLTQTRASTDEAEPLAKQLDQLRATLQYPTVASAAAAREGAAAVTSLQQAAAALRQADQSDAGVRGTPAETQRLDQLDGIIVRLVRRARKAALAAARKGGNPALARAFKLDKLYQSRAPGSVEGEQEDGGEESGEG